VNMSFLGKGITARSTKDLKVRSSQCADAFRLRTTPGSTAYARGFAI